jgi:hypothetical protein
MSLFSPRPLIAVCGAAFRGSVQGVDVGRSAWSAFTAYNQSSAWPQVGP